MDTGAGLRLELGARQVQGLGGDRHFPGAQDTLILSSSFLPSFFLCFLPFSIYTFCKFLTALLSYNLCTIQFPPVHLHLIYLQKKKIIINLISFTKFPSQKQAQLVTNFLSARRRSLCIYQQTRVMGTPFKLQRRKSHGL